MQSMFCRESRSRKRVILMTRVSMKKMERWLMAILMVSLADIQFFI